VRPGNQTALKTRAAPFAVYIARMHRRIHELWGFGFLEDLDDKPASHEMNDWSLWTKIEVVINPDGTIDKVNIARPSGVLPFDVAALDTVLSSGPFEAPPEAIRSVDGKTYLHWAFHRDWRQCGTFGAEPYILSSPPKGGPRDKGMNDGEMLGRAGRNRGKGKGKDAGGDPHAGHGHGAAGDETAENAARARAKSAVATPDDPAAKHAANLWLSGFTHGDLTKMIKISGIPFRSGGGLVANSGSEIGTVYRNIIKETRGRAVQEWRILSAAGYRKALGALPEGLEPAPGDLFMVVRLRGEQFTLVLRQHTASGEYRAVGFYR
jgi:TonB family protein